MKFYATGKPCAHGHISERYVSSGNCKTCRDAYTSPNDHENREHIKARKAAWKRANPERVHASYVAWRAANADRERAAQRAWRAANKDRFDEHTKAWRANNPEKVRIMNANYHANNKEMRKVNSHRRRARLQAAEGSHDANDIKKIYTAQKGKCACCRKMVGDDYHVDHITPLSRGGSNWPDNIQILCAPCNLSKGAKDPIQFMQSIGRLL